MADIFLSYARADRPAAAAMADILTDSGYCVWWDRHITGGAQFSADIERELGDCRVVLVAWSADARASSWVKDEASVGLQDNKLVAISLDGELPPIGFRQYHAIDFSGWEGRPDASEIDSLKQAVEARLAGVPDQDKSATEGPAPTAANTAAPPSAARRWFMAALVLVALAALLSQTSWFSAGAPAGPPGVDDAPRIAVAAFRAPDDPQLGQMADALGQNIANGLSRFSHLEVASRSDGDAVAGSPPAYRLDGALARSGDTLRLTVQLLKTTNGEQIWGNSYDRDFDPNALLAIQDDLTAYVVASVADSYGALMRDLSRPAALKAPEAMTPYEAVLRFLVYRQRIGPQDHLEARIALEHAVEKSPNDARVLAALAGVYLDEYKHDFNALPDSLGRALETARAAIAQEPENAYALFVLGEVFFFRQNLGAFRASTGRAIELNPFDSDMLAMTGILTAYSGEWERGVELSTRAMSLNPNHPGWYRFAIAYDQVRRGDYEAALETAQRINLPQYFADPSLRTVVQAQLGNEREARAAAEEFLALWPNGDLGYYEKTSLERWFFASPELTEITKEAMGKVGLEFPDP